MRVLTAVPQSLVLVFLLLVFLVLRVLVFRSLLVVLLVRVFVVVPAVGKRKCYNKSSASGWSARLKPFGGRGVSCGRSPRAGAASGHGRLAGQAPPLPDRDAEQGRSQTEQVEGLVAVVAQDQFLVVTWKTRGRCEDVILPGLPPSPGEASPFLRQTLQRAFSADMSHFILASSIPSRTCMREKV